MKKRFDVHNVHITTLSKQSAKYSVNKRRKKIITAILAVLTVFVWTYALSSFTYVSFLNISKIKIEGADKDIENSLVAAASMPLENDYWGLFSGSNTLLYPKSRIKSAVLAASERVERVDIKRNGLTGLTVSVKEKDPAALICASLPVFNSGDSDDTDRCYFADPTGVIYMKAGIFSTKMFNSYFIPDVENDAPGGVAVGKTAVASTTFRALQSFYESVRSNNMSPMGVLIKNGGEYELYIENPGKSLDGSDLENSTSTPVDTTVVYFNEMNGLQNELSNFISFWSHMVNGARNKKAQINFETIDLRYGSNVFYRLGK